MAHTLTSCPALHRTQGQDREGALQDVAYAAHHDGLSNPRK
jgi:hypothetical protein